MSIRLRLLIPMIITAVLVAAAILISDIIQFSNYVSAGIEDGLDEAVHEMANEIETMQTESFIASLFFSYDRELIAAMESGSRDAIMGRAMVLHEIVGVNMCVITDTRGVAVIRTNAPDVYGDDLSDKLCVKTALAGSPMTSIEQGITVGISTNTGVPVYGLDGAMIGAVVIGFRLDTDEFVDKMKRISGCEHTVFVDNIRVATTLLNDDGTRAIGTPAPEEISEQVMAGSGSSGQYRVLGRTMMSKVIPLADSSGNIQGMLFAGRFLTERTNTVMSFIASGSVITVSLLGISILIILLVSGRLSTPIERMIDRAYYDPLTGIFNRRYFDENIRNLIASLSRSGSYLSLMMIDIDYFKKFNDTYGHSEGDICLRAVADAIAAGLTRTEDFVARYGGEEFVVVLPHADESGACKIANRLLENVRKCCIPHEKNDMANIVTISVGVTTSLVSHNQNGDDYIKKADKLLYDSKEAGRNRYTFSNY